MSQEFDAAARHVLSPATAPRECYWVTNHGPTMGEMVKRAKLIARAFGCLYLLPHDRATVILLHNGKPGGEFPLMLDEEMADGHWVHADPHTGECEAQRQRPAMERGQ